MKAPILRQAVEKPVFEWSQPLSISTSSWLREFFEISIMEPAMSAFECLSSIDTRDKFRWVWDATRNCNARNFRGAKFLWSQDEVLCEIRIIFSRSVVQILTAMRKKREPPPDEEFRTLHIENNSTKVDEYFKKKRSEYVGGWWACLCGILALL